MNAGGRLQVNHELLFLIGVAPKNALTVELKVKLLLNIQVTSHWAFL